MENRSIKRTRWLWIMFFISWLINSLYCNYLVQRYQCEERELLFKTPFYLLSVLLVIIDLLLSISIWQRATTKYRLIPKEWEFFSFSSEIEKANGANFKVKLKGSVDFWDAERFIAAMIIFISAHSLVVDIIKLVS